MRGCMGGSFSGGCFCPWGRAGGGRARMWTKSELLNKHYKPSVQVGIYCTMPLYVMCFVSFFVGLFLSSLFLCFVVVCLYG